MADIAISVENLSKKYRIGLGDEVHDTLAGQLSSYVKIPLRNLRRLRRLTRFGRSGQGAGRAAEDVIWALKDVSFEVERGEVVGIIGRNGAGKSTLLKILSRITHPTSGRVVLNGRVSSLLEVGTGFHKELTGRENVYLNGTILGMRKAEVDAKFDKIVAFSGVEKFIDTPVKRYSSGMRVRLAFSVAAHLEPEILLVDEVLAVGDRAFRQKCIGKMSEVASSGRTVLFVSHNMGVVSDLCPRGLLLENGDLKVDATAAEAISAYLADAERHHAFVTLANGWQGDRRGKGPIKVQWVSIEDEDGNAKRTFTYGEPITFRLGLTSAIGSIVNANISLRNDLGRLVLHFSNTDDDFAIKLPSRCAEVSMRLKDNILSDGNYSVTVHISDRFQVLNDRIENFLSFSVSSPGEGKIKCQSDVRVSGDWHVKASES